MYIEILEIFVTILITLAVIYSEHLENGKEKATTIGPEEAEKAEE